MQRFEKYRKVIAYLPNVVLIGIPIAFVLLIAWYIWEEQTFSDSLPHYPNATPIPIANSLSDYTIANNLSEYNCDRREGGMHCSVSFSTLDSMDSVLKFLVKHFEKDGWQKNYPPITTQHKRTFSYTKHATWATVYLETDANGKTTLVIDCIND